MTPNDESIMLTSSAMHRPPHVRRERKLLLAVVAVSSGLTISCGARGIGLYDSGWAEMFDAAAQDAGPDAAEPHDAAADTSNDAGDTANVDAH